MKIEAGIRDELGARWDGEGTHFGVYASDAERVDLCLFDAGGNETARMPLPGCHSGVWHGFLPGSGPGQQYGFRAYGRFSPQDGLWFNPHKLLVDPYARELSGELKWSSTLFAYDPRQPEGTFTIDERDSAPFMPKAKVAGPPGNAPSRQHVAWKDTVIYEAHLRGLTMQHPDISAEDAGTIRGLQYGQVLQYLKALGITSLELLPVQAFVDEHFLHQKKLRNYWGYNTLAFFAPAPRYMAGGGPDAFREMVNTIHDAGIEVILDVVYNHTAEGDMLGPMLSFRGLDNHAYYRLLNNRPQHYINDTGTGNTINADHPRVQQLIVESLAYWATEMGADGFRFDLASILGRRSSGFASDHKLLQAIKSDPRLHDVKLIAEPWDVGPGGYQLGQFPAPWAEWNDKFRDTVRSFWLTGAHNAAEYARRLHGSADLFEQSDRKPSASINLITAHDGYTLMDLVSYERRHNQANGENNQDGHRHNLSCNHGHEGPSTDATVLALRRRQRLNLLASTLLSQGTPMLLAGDEFGNSQAGNNNAYCQDNPLGWLNWQAADDDPTFLEQVKRLIALRQNEPLLRREQYVHGEELPEAGGKNIQWLGADGHELQATQWSTLRALAMILRQPPEQCGHASHARAAALCCNACDEETVFFLPDPGAGLRWECRFYSNAEPGRLTMNEAGGWATLPYSFVYLTAR